MYDQVRAYVLQQMQLDDEKLDSLFFPFYSNRAFFILLLQISAL
jgi:hypothetical protein